MKVETARTRGGWFAALFPCALLLCAACAVWLLPASASAGDPAAGKQTFVTNCASCHGQGGEGDGPVGVALDPAPRDFTKANFKFDTDGDGEAGTDADLRNVIRNGAAKYGGSPLMAPWPTLSDEDVDNIVSFIRTLAQ